MDNKMSGNGHHDNIAVALEKLEDILVHKQGNVNQMKLLLDEFEQGGLQSKSLLVNHPMQRYDDRTAVHLAANNGMYHCLELLLQSGGNPNAKSSSADQKQTPLHLASIGGFPHCIELLLDHGADMSITNDKRVTVYDMVKGKVNCEKVFQQAVTKLEVPKRTDMQEERVEALHDLVCLEKKRDAFYNLYEELPPDHMELGTRWTDHQHQTLLYRATLNEQFAIVKFMLSQSKSQPLHNLKTFKTPLLVACQKSLYNIANILLEHSPKLLFVSEAQNKISPFHVACAKGDKSMVCLLLDTFKKAMDVAGVGISTDKGLDFRDKLGRTPLYNACYFGYSDVVRLLLDFKKQNSVVTLNVNCATKDRRTPLHAAVCSGSLETVEALLGSAKIEVNVEGNSWHKTHRKLVRSYRRMRYDIKEQSDVLCRISADAGISPKAKCSQGECIDNWVDFLAHTNEKVDIVAQHVLKSERSYRSMPRRKVVNQYGAGIVSKVEEFDIDWNNLKVYESSVTSELSCRPNCLESSTEFNKLSITPLAEACALLHIEIVKKLLQHGAHDDFSGLACRIAYLYQCPSLLQLILSYHAVSKRVSSKTLELRWNHKKLPLCEGDWLSSKALFFSKPQYGDAGILVSLNFDAILSVRLDDNQLLSVPLELFQLQNVKRIILANNKISKLPLPLRARELNSSGVGWICPHLEELDVSGNKLTSIPDTLWVLPQLQHLNFSKNMVGRLFIGTDIHKDSINDLNKSKLKFLDLSSNCLSGALPDLLFTLPCLHRLNLSYNKLSEFPVEVWKSSTLKELDMANNLLTYITVYSDLLNSIVRSENVMTVNPCGCSLLLKLNLSSNLFSDFPEALACLAPNLTHLNISENSKLSVIDICFLPSKLKELKASNCSISRFGTVLSKYYKLELYQNCRGSTLPGVTCKHRNHVQLLHLTTLDISFNKLSHFQLLRQEYSDEPDDLEAIEAKYSKTSSVADLLFPALRSLDLTSNQLQGTFNPNIGHQAHLASIRLSNNPDLREVPMELAYLKKYRDLVLVQIDNLKGLREPPPDYQNVSVTRLLSYMQSKLQPSSYNRSIKLFFIGNEGRGKSTLMRGLRNISMESEESNSLGVKYGTWIYPSTRSLKEKMDPVTFITCDCAGEEVHHECFYSKQSLYLAIFKLSDVEGGVEELEEILRGVQTYAPGCPVLIVGTHADKVTPDTIASIEAMTLYRYRKFHGYPEIIGIKCLSNSTSQIEELRDYLFSVACHLSVSGSGENLSFNPTMLESDPKALFQQLVPQTFLKLQARIKEESAKLMPPIMEESHFRSTFMDIIDDEDEMDEAVYFLTIHGELLHFSDHELRNFYFLDSCWLSKLIADLLKHCELVSPGVAEVSSLFFQHTVSPELRYCYICLMEKFNMALQIKDAKMIVPSRLPLGGTYQKPIDHIEEDEESKYQPPLRRLWFMEFVPAGFWPRLLSRIITDNHIERVLKTLSGLGRQSLQSNEADTGLSLAQCASGDKSAAEKALEWMPWKTGLAFVHQKRTLMVIHQVTNSLHKEFSQTWHEERVDVMNSRHRIEFHIYTNECILLAEEILGSASPLSLIKSSVMSLATRLLTMVSWHVKALAQSWFPGMLKETLNQPFITYLPCWKCYAESSFTDTGQHDSSCAKEEEPITVFVLEDCIVPAFHGKSLVCSTHGKIKIDQAVPDLVFADLTHYAPYCATSEPLHFDSEIIGCLGPGFIVKGQLQSHSEDDVAILIPSEDSRSSRNLSINELLEVSSKDANLWHTYRAVRHIASYLLNLDHPNVIKMCGVTTSPHMCLIMELAAMNLHEALEEYRKHDQVLAPLTLKCTALQIAEGLQYLHSNQLVHLNIKSTKILLFEFPLPSRDGRESSSSGPVLVKISGFYLCRVSTDGTVCCRSSPTGTRGFIAPELFSKNGVIVSSEKADVFSYGMVLYELISRHFPFLEYDAFQRTYIVQEGQRPILEGWETHTPTKLQELMRICWDKNPERRPNMKQVVKWICAPEFVRLRSEIVLKQVKRVVCVCTGYIPGQSPNSPQHSGLVWKRGESCEEKLRGYTDAASEMEQFRGRTLLLVYSHDQSLRKDVLLIVTYIDGQPGYQEQIFVWDQTLSHGAITTMHVVCGKIWMGTSVGTVRVCHAPSFSNTDIPELDHGWTSNFSIRKMVYVEEMKAVMVCNGVGQLWCYNQDITDGLQLLRKIELARAVPLIQLIKVVLTGNSKVEVWGFMDKRRVLIIDDAWNYEEIDRRTEAVVDTQSSFHAAYTSFTDDLGCKHGHVWMSVKSPGLLVSFTADDRKQRCVLNCREKLKKGTVESFEITSLTCSGHKVLVGTSIGAVMIFDSKSTDLLEHLNWHEEAVHTLTVLPQNVRSCICAEISFQEVNTLQEVQSATSEADSAIVASIGKGKLGYYVPAEWEKERSVNCAMHGTDNVLLLWKLTSI